MLRSVVAAITVSSFTWTFTMAEAPGQSTLDVSYVHPQETVASVETRVHDLSKAIAAHVESSDYAANVAREAAIQTLFAGFDSGGGIVHKEEIEPGKFRVAATKAAHDELRFWTEWMEAGEKQVCIETQIVTVGEADLKKLHKRFAKRWKMSSVARSKAEPPRNSPVISPATFRNQPPTARLVSAQTGSTRSLPSRFVVLNAKESHSVVNQQGRDSSRVMHAPKVTMFDGQFATVKDTIQKPFVVSVKPTSDGEATALVPVVDVLDEGLTIDLNVSVVDDRHTRVGSKISFSRIVNVDTFTFDVSDESKGTTVQIPEQLVKSVELDSTLKDGDTLLIDPHFYTTKTVARRFRSDLETREFTLILLRATVLDVQDMAVQDVPARDVPLQN